MRVLVPVELKVTLQLPLPPASVMEQLLSAPKMATVPVGVAHVPLTVTLTATAWPGMDGSGVSAVMVVEELFVTLVTVWFTLLELVTWDPSPLYTAVRVLAPIELKTTLQVPLPPESVMVQFVSAPLMATVPVGVEPDPPTVTPTATASPGVDGSGVSAVMVVVVAVDPLFETLISAKKVIRPLPTPN